NFVDGALNPNINLAANVSPKSITITNNAANPYSFSGTGTFSSIGTLTKSGLGYVIFSNAGGSSFGTVIINSGTVVFANTNSIGALTVSGGTLQIGAGTTSGDIGSVAIANNGAVVVDHSDSITLANAISGSG